MTNKLASVEAEYVFDHGVIEDDPHEHRGNRAVCTMVIEKNALVVQGLTQFLSGTEFRIRSANAKLDDLPELSSDDTEYVLLLGLGDNADAVISDLSRWKLLCVGRSVRIIVMTQHFSIDEAIMAMKAGASCYFTKDQITRAFLLRSLELALRGNVVLSEQFASDLAEAPILGVPTPSGVVTRSSVPTTIPTDDVPELSGLSGRERLILSHLMSGASNKQIARDLGIAEATVKVHVKGLLRKLRVKNRTRQRCGVSKTPTAKTRKLKVQDRGAGPARGGGMQAGNRISSQRRQMRKSATWRPRHRQRMR